MPRRHVLLLSSASLVAVAALLAGCGSPALTPSATPGSSESPSPTPSATPTDAPPAPSATPVAVRCDALITAQAMYDFNPNFSLISSWTPDGGSAAAEALAAKGVACRWKNDTSGDTIDVSVAALDQASLEKKANTTYGASTMVPTYGGEGYFSVTNGVGEAVVFDRGYWVVARSSYFLEPGDASPIVEPVLAALP